MQTGTGLNNSSDNDNAMSSEDTSSAKAGRVSSTNRRRFTRNAIAGSAVILSLGNRSAWGAKVDPANCMSVATLNSFNPNIAEGFASMPPDGKDGHSKALAEDIHRITGDQPPGATAIDYSDRTCPASGYASDSSLPPIACQDPDNQGTMQDKICVAEAPKAKGSVSADSDADRTGLQNNLLFE